MVSRKAVNRILNELEKQDGRERGDLARKNEELKKAEGG